MAYSKLNLADGTTLKAEHLAHMETELAREKSWNELADKPFGESLTEIMAETEVTGTVSGSGLYIVTIDSALFSGAETLLRVVCDGVKYDCAAWSTDGFVGFGNRAFLGGTDTGEPFVLGPSEGVVMFADANAHTIAISAIDINHIDSKYVKTRSGFYVGDDEYIYTDLSYSTKATCAELVTAYNKGDVYLNYAGLASIPVIYLSAAYTEYAHAVACMSFADGAPVWGSYYTAEYTAS